MALPEFDSLVGYAFGIRVDGVEINLIQEVSGLKLEQDVIELKQNTADGKYVVKKLPGRRQTGEITLTRGLTDDSSFDEWIKASRFGKMGDARKGGAIILYDAEGTAVRSYRFTNGWPKSLEIGELKAGEATVLTEKLTVTYEDMDVE